MTDSTHSRPVPLHAQTIGLGAFLAAMLIVAALVLVAVKLVDGPREELRSLLPLDPAAWSGFTA